MKKPSGILKENSTSTPTKISLDISVN